MNWQYFLYPILLFSVSASAQIHISLQTGYGGTNRVIVQSDEFLLTGYKRMPHSSYRLTISKPTKKLSDSVGLDTEFGISFSRDGFSEEIKYSNTWLKQGPFTHNKNSTYYFLEMHGGLRFNFNLFKKRISLLSFIAPGLLINQRYKSNILRPDGTKDYHKSSTSLEDLLMTSGTSRVINLSGGISVTLPVKLSNQHILNIGPYFRHYLFPTNNNEVSFNHRLYSAGIDLTLKHISAKAMKRKQNEQNNSIVVNKLFYRNHISVKAGYLFKHNNFKPTFTGKGSADISFSDGWMVGGNFYLNFPERYTLSLGLEYATQHYVLKYVYFPYTGYATSTSSLPNTLLRIPCRALMRTKIGSRIYITPSIGVTGVYSSSKKDTVEHFYFITTDTTSIYYQAWGAGRHTLATTFFDFKNVINPEIGLGFNYVLANKNIVNLDFRCTYESTRVNGVSHIYENNKIVGSDYFREKGLLFSVELNYTFSRSKPRKSER